MKMNKNNINKNQDTEKTQGDILEQINNLQKDLKECKQKTSQVKHNIQKALD